MATTTFDTLQAAKHLQESGVERKQAEAIVRVMHDGQGELVTKSDIIQLQADIGRLETELKGELKEHKNYISWIKWGLGFNVVLTLAVLATVTLN